MRILAFLIAVTAAAATSVPPVPVWFEPSGEGGFVSRGGAGRLRLAPTAAEFSLPGETQSLRLQLSGARVSAAAEGLDRLRGTTQYLLGKDRRAWKTGVPQFGRVKFSEVYPGIDVVYYAQGSDLEYDFVVKPGGNPQRIRLRLEGARSVRLTEDGALLIDLGGRVVRQAAPAVYQESNGARTTIAGRYALRGTRQVRFEVGAYDRTKPLVIDPVLNFASYVGWDRMETILAVAPAADGSMWVTGTTYSSRPPAEGQKLPYADLNQGVNDAYVMRLVPGVMGTPGTVAYITYLGGTSSDQGEAIGLDSSGAVIIAGWTISGDFPVAGNAPQSAFANSEDAFVARVDPNLEGADSLTFSTYYGGSDGVSGANREFAYALAVRPNGNIVVTGTTTAGVLPSGTVAAMQPSNQGGFDLFVAEFIPGAGSASEALVYSSFVGGDGSDSGAGVALDSAGRVYVTGMTSSTNFPVAGPAIAVDAGGLGDAFLLILDTSKAGLDGFLYGSYFGGGDLDAATAIAIDGSGKVWLTGYTLSDNFPTTPGAYRTARAGDTDSFLARLDVTLERQNGILNSTYLGGGQADVATAIVLTGDQTAVVGGYTYSADFPKIGTVIPPGAPPFGADMFLSQFDFGTTGPASLVFAGTINGASADTVTGLAVDPKGNLLFVGSSNSSNLPVIDGTLKLSEVGIPAGFVGRIAPTVQ
jgi:hypothetical protein